MAPDLPRLSRNETRGSGLSNPLKILLAASDGGRAVLLERRIREIGNAVILHIPPGGNLLDAVASTAPDVVIVDMARPDREMLDALRRVGAADPRPVVLFVGRDDPSFMEEAIMAGVSSYSVADTAFPNVAPIVMAAIAIFRKHRQLAAALQQATVRLDEIETINRAKRLLMAERGIGEPQAYRRLRRTAMREGRRIAAIAADLLARAKESGTERG
jgi:response regulator NasT